ncbi:unnamed protein product [Arctogadus glacialis]
MHPDHFPSSAQQASLVGRCGAEKVLAVVEVLFLVAVGRLTQSSPALTLPSWGKQTRLSLKQPARAAACS